MIRWSIARRLAAAVSAAISVSMVVAACGSASNPTLARSNNLLRVVATTTQLTNFATVIGGAHATVYSLLQPNVDAHDFEPSPADLEAIANADVVVKNGVGLEKWFDDVVRAAAPRGEIVDASVGVKVRDGDPHIWQNPQNAMIMVKNITDAFARSDAAHRSEYRASESSYDRQLAELDREIASEIDSLQNKKLVTNHDAFGYFVEHYGLTFVGAVIPSFDTSAELSASALSALVASVRREGVKAVFSERSLPPKAAATLAREAGVIVVQGEAALYGDALGPAGSPGASYLEMMRHNAETIVKNLS